ncbi:MAG: Uma2 family endonuclease [Acidobacteriota bacterium]
MNTQTLSKGKTQRLSQNNGKEKIQPLENGDHLTRAEFERRYEAMPNVKAELIEGVVYMSSPVRITHHAKPHSRIMLWLGNYLVENEAVDLADNPTVRLDLDNEPQPDAVLFIKEEFGGNSYISNDDYLEGSPELVVEIAASTASYDTTEKKKIYRRNGVKEYIIWRVNDKEIDWFALSEGEYISLEKDKNGVVESRFFGGLRLNVEALLNDNLAQVLAGLQKGLKSKNHQDFVKSLAK